MSDIKLFRFQNNSVLELVSKSVALEKSLQALIEKHLEPLLGIRFLASEYSTGKTHGGRIDTLGIDENRCPVIIEYKRSTNENVINQGLFYLDWLMDHKAEYELLILKQFSEAESEKIEWGSPRLLCIAGDFTKYDEHAVTQINRNIELIRYRKYDDEFLLFELVNATTATAEAEKASWKSGSAKKYKSVSESLQDADQALTDRYEALKDFMIALGDDVQLKVLKYYFAFKRIKNFACVEIRPTNNTILLYAKVNPGTITLEDGFTRDVKSIGHFGTGDLEITIKSDEDFERAKQLILRSYEES